MFSETFFISRLLKDLLGNGSLQKILICLSGCVYFTNYSESRWHKRKVKFVVLHFTTFLLLEFVRIR